MPEVNEQLVQSNEALAEKVNALGADTIMGAMAQAHNDEFKENANKLQEAIEENASESNKNVTTGAITGDTLEALKKAGFVPKVRPIVRDNKKIGRNDPCPCGSGKKYKNCCMNTGKYETTHFE